MFDYNDYNPSALYQPDPFRSSDHDPLLIGLALIPEATATPTRSPTLQETITPTSTFVPTPTQTLLDTPTSTPEVTIPATATETLDYNINGDNRIDAKDLLELIGEEVSGMKLFDFARFWKTP